MKLLYDSFFVLMGGSHSGRAKFVRVWQKGKVSDVATKVHNKRGHWV